MTIIANGSCRIVNIKFKTSGKDDVDCIAVKNGNVMFQNCELSKYYVIHVLQVQSFKRCQLCECNWNEPTYNEQLQSKVWKTIWSVLVRKSFWLVFNTKVIISIRFI
jgi:hypothetical protein